VKICLTEVDDIVCVEIGIVDQGDKLATTLNQREVGKNKQWKK
jgi:hypothetical protein